VDLKFGLFVPPVHSVRESPTQALHRDVALTKLAEDLGYDEVWYGEHHTLGTEIIAAPEVFIAYAAAKTSRIRLGTGAITLPYHNPLWVAERMLLLDHLTRGRIICGVGPGSAPSDAEMIGLDASSLRPALEEDIEVLWHLLTNDEPLSVKTDRYELRDAMLQLRPYQKPCFELAVPAVASAIGPRVAGRYGAGLLSIATSTPQGFQTMESQWGTYEDSALEAGRVADRSAWRLTGFLHIAETREQALEDVRFGMMEWFDHFQKNTAHPAFQLPGTTYEERMQLILDTGMAIIGTPDDAVEVIEKYIEHTGGFGTFLQFEHDMVNWAAKQRHHELFASYVMPRFQGHLDRTQRMQDTVRARRDDDTAKYQAALDSYAANSEKRLAAEPATSPA
jgi:limonene 1,2-monooxygenase